MRAELKSLFNSDYDLEVFTPEKENFSIFVEAHIGEAGKDGSDIFTFHVCNPGWLSEKYNEEAIFLKGYLLVPFYNFGMIQSKIETLIKSISGKSWEEFANNLSRYADWEFENYIE